MVLFEKEGCVQGHYILHAKHHEKSIYKDRFDEWKLVVIV